MMLKALKCTDGGRVCNVQHRCMCMCLNYESFIRRRCHGILFHRVTYSTFVIETTCTTDTNVCVHVSAFCCSYIRQACAVVYCSVYQSSLSPNMLFDACLFLSNSFSKVLSRLHVQ